MKNIMHMHGLLALNSIKTHGKQVLNGYIGDLVLGGSYLKRKPSGNLMSYHEIADYKYGDDITVYENEEYFRCNSSDPCFIFNRGSRFTSLGTKLLSEDLVTLKPFVNNKLLDYVYSLPDIYRLDGRLYHSMLLKYYPEYFASIPWQSIGRPIKSSLDTSVNTRKIMPYYNQKIKDFIKRTPFFDISLAVYNKIFSNASFLNYADLVTTEDYKLFEKKMLNTNFYSCFLKDKLHLNYDKASLESKVACLTIIYYFENIRCS
jgi:asparagine synthase (glutamine-hydrolysing)